MATLRSPSWTQTAPSSTVGVFPTPTVENFVREHTGAKVAIEASSVYRHIYHTLDEYVDVTLVNPKKRVVAEAKVKTDKIDAEMLAHLLRADLVAESYVPPADIRRRRDLVASAND